MHLSQHILYSLHHSQYNQSNILWIAELRLRTPSPESQLYLRHGGAQYPPQGRSCPRGNHLLDHKPFLRTGKFITNVADLGRDSQKALPRSYLGSLDSVIYGVTSSGGHTIFL